MSTFFCYHKITPWNPNNENILGTPTHSYKSTNIWTILAIDFLQAITETIVHPKFDEYRSNIVTSRAHI